MSDRVRAMTRDQEKTRRTLSEGEFIFMVGFGGLLIFLGVLALNGTAPIIAPLLGGAGAAVIAWSFSRRQRE